MKKPNWTNRLFVLTAGSLLIGLSVPAAGDIQFTAVEETPVPGLTYRKITGSQEGLQFEFHMPVDYKVRSDNANNRMLLVDSDKAVAIRFSIIKGLGREFFNQQLLASGKLKPSTQAGKGAPSPDPAPTGNTLFIKPDETAPSENEELIISLAEQHILKRLNEEFQSVVVLKKEVKTAEKYKGPLIHANCKINEVEVLCVFALFPLENHALYLGYVGPKGSFNAEGGVYSRVYSSFIENPSKFKREERGLGNAL